MPEEPAPDAEGITITRVFDAPRELVFKAWTEPERFVRWFGLGDSEVPLSTIAMDVRPCGAWRATMFAGPDRYQIQWRGGSTTRWSSPSGWSSPSPTSPTGSRRW